MVIPICAEREWRRVLGALPEWHPPAAPTVVISPHPDDETLAVGGLIHRLATSGVDVTVIAVTDGENAYPGESGLGPIREDEQAAALMILGVTANGVRRLRLCDSGLLKVEAELTKTLRDLIRPGMHVVAPWIGDFHPDHEVCGRAAKAVATAAGASLSYYFFWTWHRGTPATVDGLNLVSFGLEPDEVVKKNEALLCHRSQLEHPNGEPILPLYLLEPLRRTYEVFLPA